MTPKVCIHGEREQKCDEGRDERYDMTPKVCIHRERAEV